MTTNTELEKQSFKSSVCVQMTVCLMYLIFFVSVGSSVRNIHDNKVSGQLSSNSSNHNARLGSDEHYMNVAHRLGNEVMERISLS